MPRRKPAQPPAVVVAHARRSRRRGPAGEPSPARSRRPHRDRRQRSPISAGPRRSRRWPRRPAIRRTNHVDDLRGSASTTGSSSIYPDVPDNYRSRLDVQWPLYNSGRLTAMERAARSEARRRTSTAHRPGRTCRWRSRAPTGRSSPRSSQLRVVEQSMAAHPAHLETFATGASTRDSSRRNDVFAIEAQESRQRCWHPGARQPGYRGSRARPADRHAPGTRFSRRRPLAPPAPLSAGLESLVAEAASRRTEREALSRRLTAAEERVKAAAASNRPTVRREAVSTTRAPTRTSSRVSAMAYLVGCRRQRQTGRCSTAAGAAPRWPKRRPRRGRCARASTSSTPS